MLGFAVSVNGKKLCVASSDCVLSTILTYAARKPDRIDFTVGGISEENSDKHVEWTTPVIQVGDEITIRIVETESPDPPDRVYLPGLAGDRENQAS